MLLEKDFEQLQKYVEGTCSETETVLVESKIASSIEWQEEYQILLEMDQFINHFDERESFKKRLKAFHESAISEKEAETKIFKLPTKWMSIAASIALLVTCYFVFNPSPSTDQLYSEYKDHSLVWENVHKGTAQDNYESLTTAFRNGEYEKAATLFENVDEKIQKEYALNWAIATLYANKAKAAIPKFNAIIEGEDYAAVDKNAAQWYLSLCFLQLEDKVSAIEAAKKVSELDSFYYAKAQKLLKDLN